MTYEQAKDQIANEEGYSSFDLVIYDDKINRSSLVELSRRAAELYADSVARDAWQRAIERFMVFNDFNPKTCDIPEYQPK